MPSPIVQIVQAAYGSLGASEAALFFQTACKAYLRNSGALDFGECLGLPTKGNFRAQLRDAMLCDYVARMPRQDGTYKQAQALLRDLKAFERKFVAWQHLWSLPAGATEDDHLLFAAFRAKPPPTTVKGLQLIVKMAPEVNSRDFFPL